MNHQSDWSSTQLIKNYRGEKTKNNPGLCVEQQNKEHTHNMVDTRAKAGYFSRYAQLPFPPGDTPQKRITNGLSTPQIRDISFLFTQEELRFILL